MADFTMLNPEIGWGAQANSAITSKSTVASSKFENRGTNVDFAVVKIVS
jgi:hypothetical protein